MGQDTFSTQRRWKLGFGISPDIAYRTLKVKQDRSSASINSKRNEVEHPRMVFSGGFHANYMFNNRWGIGTGLVYSVKGYQTERHWVGDWHFLKSQLPFEPYYLTSTYGSGSLEIPVTAILVLGKGRLRSITNLGMACNVHVLSNYRSTLEYEDGRVFSGRSSELSPSAVDLSGVVSTGLSYKMTELLDLRIEPNFRHAILTSSSSVFNTTLFWNAGINISAFIDLR